MSRASKRKEIKLLAEEYWWGGAARHGHHMPFSAQKPYRHSMQGTTLGNQSAPLLVSNKGRYIWSEDPFTFEFSDGWLFIEDELSDVAFAEGFNTLRGAYRAASKRFFPPSQRIPNQACFLAPQYNTWIDMGKNPTQVKVLQYAQEIIDKGMPPGVLMIDDFWYRNNGIWEWDVHTFPDPKAMIDQLHQWGFQVVVWVSPWVSADTRRYQKLAESQFLILTPEQLEAQVDAGGEAAYAPVIQRWWNGASAVLDLSNPAAFSWFQEQLDYLVAYFDVDGFKFDGGDPIRYQPTDISYTPRTPNGHAEDYGRIGLKYDISEYRACWKLGGQHLIQRVRDKAHSWGEGGLADTLPTSLAHGILGYPYTCPDMVGGGELGAIPNKIDQELYVRWVQSATFFPIIQYSMLPHRVLDADHLKICSEAIQQRNNLSPTILELARHAAQTGDPIMRYMAYEFPSGGMETVTDQFMLGDTYLVAPVLSQGQTRRVISFPAGVWQGEDGRCVKGPCEIEVEAPLTRLPWYTRIG